MRTFVVAGFAALTFGCNAPVDPPEPAITAGPSLDARAQDTWSLLAPLPVAREMVAVDALGGLVYVAGGNSPSGPSVNVDAYDPVTNSWSARPPLPRPRWFGNGGATLQGKLYVPGGFDGSGRATNTNFRFDPASNRWEPAARMPAGGGCGGTTVHGGQLYVYIGCTAPGGQYTSLFFRYDPRSNRWSTLAPPNQKHVYPAIAAVRGEIFVAGGIDGDFPNPIFTAAVEAYNPATNRWRRVASMPTIRYFASARNIAGRMYVVGGRCCNGGAYLDTVERYDPVSDSWDSLSPMPTPRYALGTAIIQGRLYAVGGFDLSHGPWNANEVYAP